MSILNSKFYMLADRFSNILILNILWLLTCIPIVTITPATTAMFSVVRQWQLHQDTSVVRNYLRYFKENFKQSFLIGIIWMFLSVLLYLNYFYLQHDQSVLKSLIIVPLVLVSIVFLCTSVYLFPVLTHYKVSWQRAIKSSFLLSIGNLPTTLLILTILTLLLAIGMFLPITFFMIFCIGAYINFSLVNRIFQKMGEKP